MDLLACPLVRPNCEFAQRRCRGHRNRPQSAQDGEDCGDHRTVRVTQCGRQWHYRIGGPFPHIPERVDCPTADVRDLVAQSFDQGGHRLGRQITEAMEGVKGASAAGLVRVAGRGDQGGGSPADPPPP